MAVRSQQVLLEAVKASLFGTPFSYPEDTDWSDVIKEAKSQTVSGLISSVIPAHDKSSDQSKAYYIRMLYEQDQLLKLFDEHNISCVILKGCAAAVYYPKPYLRTMGDVDILVPRAQFEDAMKILESSGYKYLHGKDDNGAPWNEVRHIEYEKNGIEYELHHHFSTAGFDMDDILERAIEKREYRTLNGFRFPLLPEIENGLVLLGHMYQHLRKDELGLRQIIDWEMYLQSVMDIGKWEKQFFPVAKELGLSELAVHVTMMCEKHLGLSESFIPIDSAEDGIADQLLENILTYGNFGRRQTPPTEQSGGRIMTVTGNIQRKGLFAYCQDNGLKTWKLCKKYPALKPFAFIYGFFRFIVRGITGIIKTGKIREQVEYIINKRRFNQDLGIGTKGKEND